MAAGLVAAPSSAADVSSGTTSWVSRRNNNQTVWGTYSQISGDGRSVVFMTNALNMVPGQNWGAVGFTYHRNLQTGAVTPVSVSALGQKPNLASAPVDVSHDGTKVLFKSFASNLVLGDTNATIDLFVRDLTAGTTTRVSVGTGGVQGAGTSLDGDLSPDGRFVAFTSTAPNLVPGDTNGVADVFLRDLQTGVTERVSISPGGNQAVTAAGSPSISADGRFVAFDGYFEDPGVPTGVGGDVYVRDRRTGTTELASVGAGGVPSNDDSGNPVLSAGGRFVAFESAARNLVPGDTDFAYDVFVRDRWNGTTEIVSVRSNGAHTSEDVQNPAMTPDGRFVTFAAEGDDLAAEDDNLFADVYRHDRLTHTTQLISVATNGAQGDDSSEDLFDMDGPRISADGASIVFETLALNFGGPGTEGEGVVLRTTPVPAAALAAPVTGPTAAVAPYLAAAAPGVQVTSLLTTGGATVGGYGLVGRVSGVGVTPAGGLAQIVTTHDLGVTEGLPRAHGAPGAFAAALAVDPSSLAVTSAHDLLTSVRHWNPLLARYQNTPTAPATAGLSGLGAPAVAAAGQLAHVGGIGTSDAIVLTPEAGSGRMLGTVLPAGQATELPRLGLAPWAGVLFSPAVGSSTVTAGLDRSAGGRLHLYRGTKLTTGTPFQRAGLGSGGLMNVRVSGVSSPLGIDTEAEFAAAHPVGTPVAVNFPSVDWRLDLAGQRAASVAKGALQFSGIVDAAFEPGDPRSLWFVTAGNGGSLWRLQLKDALDPAKGGTLTRIYEGGSPLVDGIDGITFDTVGNLLITERAADGKVARLVALRLSDLSAGVVVAFDPTVVVPGGSRFRSADERFGDVVDASAAFGPGSFLVATRLPTAAGLPSGTGTGTGAELVEHGQLVLVRVTDWAKVYDPQVELVLP